MPPRPDGSGVFIALGANQNSLSLDGKALSPLQTFIAVLQDFTHHQIEVIAVSGIWQSPAWPDPSKPAYKNAVVQIRTDHDPSQLLMFLKTCEGRYGRDPHAQRNASRPLDLDIIDYDGMVYASADLTLPHPRMFERGFVLMPLAEIAPHWSDPQKNRAIHEWTARLDLKSTQNLHWVGKINFTPTQ